MNYFFKTLIFSIVIFFSFSLSAQESKKIDRLYLKGNNYVKGIILDTLSDGSIRFKLLIGNEIVFKKDDILKYKQSRKKYFIQHGRYLFPANGFYATIQSNLYVSLIEIDPDSYIKRPVYIGTQFSSGYQIRPYLAFGAGLETTYSLSNTPVFIEVKGALNKRRISPIYTFHLGSTFFMDKNEAAINKFATKTNLFTFTSLGIRIVSFSNLSTELTVGIKSQYAKIHSFYPIGGPDFIRPSWNHYFILGLGVTF